MSDVKDRWAEFLNPEIVRTKFVAMGLFMVAHEMLLEAIRERLLSFFANEWMADSGWQQSKQHRKEILARDPKGKGDALRGSLAWLTDMGAIDDHDVTAVREFTHARNMIAHELRNIVGGGTGPDFASLFPRLIQLVAKIDRWWVVNVDIAIDPDLAGQEIDHDGVIPGSILIIQILGQVALGEEEEAWALYRAFVDSEGAT